MSHDDIPSPARRADAERNRSKILDAARAAFAESDDQLSMAEISRRAGVGMATLYRNFPGLRELLEALYAHEVDAICEAARSVEGETSLDVLVTWLHQSFAFATSKRAIATELLTHVDSRSAVFSESRARVLAAGRPLLVAAQRAHEVRDDLALEQVLDMIVAIATIHGDTKYLEPILQTALDGLRPSTDSEPA